MSRPIPFVWRDGKMEPLARFRSLAEKTYEVGRTYILEPIEERSALSHRHYHACLRSAWLNLPEDLTEQFPNQDALRKYALVKNGYCNERSVVCSTAEEAQKIAGFIQEIEAYAIVTVNDRAVRVFTAKSQSYRAMGKQEFQRSKDLVLTTVADLIGTDRKTLEAQHPETNETRLGTNST